MSSRDAMIDTAANLFRQRGVAATSLRDVVAASGAPRGSIYHHFPGGKAELAEAATRRAGAFIERALTDLLDAGDPDAAVASFAASWERTLTGSDFQDGCPVAAAALSSDETSAARAAAGEAFVRWESLLADALVARGVPQDDAADRAALAICAIEGALVVARARRSSEPLRQVARQLRALAA